MAVRTISTSLKLDGEQEFKRQMNSVNSELSTLKSEMSLVTAEFKGQANSLEALTAKNRILQQQYDQQAEKVKVLERAVQDAADAYGDADKRTDDYRRQLNYAKTALANLSSELQQNNQYMEEAKRSADKCATSIDEYGNAVEKADSQTGKLGISLGNAFTVGAVSGAVQELVGKMSELVEETEEYRRVQASLEQSSKLNGYTAEETAASYRQLVGVLNDTQTAATTAANLQALKLIQEDLTKITEGTIGAWVKYGDSIPIDGLAESINETVQVAQVTGTFADVLNWAGTSEDAFNEKLEAAGSASERANLVLEELASQGLISAAEGWRENNQAMVEANEESARSLEVMAQMAEIIQPAFTAARSQINDLGQAFADLLSGETDANEFANRAIEILTSFAGGIAAALPEVLETGVSIVQALAEGVADRIPDLINQVPAILEAFTGYIMDHLADANNKGMELVQSLAGGVAEGLPALAEVLPEILTQWIQFISDSLPTIIEQGTEMLNSLIDGILEAIPTLVDNLPRIMVAIITGIAELLPEIAKSGVSIIMNLIEGIVKAIPQIQEVLPEVISAIVLGIAALMGSILETGKNIVLGIWEGIVSMADWLTEQVKDFFSGIVDSVKDFLGIHSPSTVFQTIGEYMMQGLALGMENSKGEVMETADDIVEEVTNRFNTLSDALSARQDINDLEYQLWEMTAGKNASEEEKYAKQVEILNQQQKDQAGIVDAAQKAYEAVAEQYGVNSAESMEYQKTLLQEQIAYQELLEKIHEVIAAKQELSGSLSADEYLSSVGTVGNMQDAGLTGQQFQAGLAQAVNGISTAVGTGTVTQRTEIPLIINGKEFARAVLTDFRAVEKTTPEVLDDV